MVDKINKMFNNKYSMALFVVGVLWIITVLIGFSYALWEMNHTQSGSNSLATSCFEINFVETSESINLANAAPLSDEKGLRTVPYEFKVVNKCDQFYNYEITLDIIDANTTLDLSKVKVTLDGADTLTPTILNTLPTAIEEEVDIRTSYILGSGELDYQEEKTYQLRLWLDETSTQTEMNKLFEGRVTIKNVQAVKPGTLKVASSSEAHELGAFLGSAIRREQIEEIEFVSNQEVPAGVTGSWDVSSTNDGSIMAWYEPIGSNGRYKVTIGTTASRVIANEDSSFLFSSLNNLNSLNFNDNFDTSKVMNMRSMFFETGYNSTNFTLNLGNGFNTSNVTDMSFMFYGTGYNSQVFTLNLGENFDTSKVIDMGMMFRETGYKSTAFVLDLKDNFNTLNVTDMDYMFAKTGYTNPNFTLGLGNKFNTSKVINMSYMFWQTGRNSTVFTLDVSGFDTSNVTDMSGMFELVGNDSEVFTLDISSFDTTNVTNMNSMFYMTAYNSPIFTLNLGNGFDTSKVTDMGYMFSAIGGVNPNFTFDLGEKFNTSNVTNMEWMFQGAGGTNPNFTLDLGEKFNTSKVTNTENMFESVGYYNSNFILDLGLNFDMSKVTKATDTFYNLGLNTKIYVYNTTLENYITVNRNVLGLYNEVTVINCSTSSVC